MDHAIDDEGDDSTFPSLHELFISRDYVSTVLELPTKYQDGWAKSHNSRPNSNNDNSDDACNSNNDTLKIEIFHSNAACTDPDLTGQVLWPISIVLSQFMIRTLLSTGNMKQLQNVSILELGCGGTALPSITSYYCCCNNSSAHQYNNVGATSISSPATTTASSSSSSPTTTASSSTTYTNKINIVATDGNDHVVLDLLRTNIQHHNSNSNNTDNYHTHTTTMNDSNTTSATTNTTSISVSLSCQQLVWGNRSHIRSLHEYNQYRPYTYIIAADVIQWPAVLEPLLHTVQAFMYNDNCNNNESESIPYNQSKFIVASVIRSTMIYQQFIDLAKSMGFTIRIIDPIEYTSNTCSSLTHPKQNDRYATQILELTLSVPMKEVPILLRQQSNVVMDYEEGQQVDDNNDDMVVGTSYKHTTFLPC